MASDENKASRHRPPYLPTVVAHFKDGRLPADLARAFGVAVAILQGVGGAAEAFLLQLTHPAAFDLKLGQIGRFGSAAARKSGQIGNNYRAGRAASRAKLLFRSVESSQQTHNTMPALYLAVLQGVIFIKMKLNLREVIHA